MKYQISKNKLQISSKFQKIYQWFTETREKGFTLVELLIYMGVFSILLSVLTMIFTQIIDTQLESQATSFAEQDSKFILSRLSYDVPRAQSITSPSLGASAAASLVVVIGGTPFTFSLDGANNMTVSSVNGTFTLNSFDTEISNLSFQRLGNAGGKNVIRVTYTVTSKTAQLSGGEVRTITSVIGTR